MSTDYPRAVVDAVFALEPDSNAISDPIPVDGRFFVLKSVERYPSKETSLADAATSIRQKLLALRRQQTLDQLVQEAKARLKVETDAAKLASISVQPPAGPPASPISTGR
jgi:parvulin-like peptidyl-prolyl isomerase